MSMRPLGSLPHPLSCHFEEPGLPVPELPRNLAALYGSGLGFGESCLYANFVASIDGIVALDEEGRSGSIISGASVADRFVMGLLRACAEVVVVGGGTFRATPNHRWTAEQVFPSLAGDFQRLRAERGLPLIPKLVVVSASGGVDADHPALRGPALVLTTSRGAARLRGHLPATCEVRALGDQRPSAEAVLEAVRSDGAAVVLTEGGPSFLGPLVAAGLLEELFLTVAPRLVGQVPESRRRSLVEDADVLGLPGADATLVSLRQYDSQLFLRYRLGRTERDPDDSRRYPV